jgi:hypothetical protein
VTEDATTQLPAHPLQRAEQGELVPTETPSKHQIATLSKSPPPRQTVRSQRFAEPLRPEVTEDAAPQLPAYPLKRAGSRSAGSSHQAKQSPIATLETFTAANTEMGLKSRSIDQPTIGYRPTTTTIITTASKGITLPDNTANSKTQVCNNQPATHAKIPTESHFGKNSKPA